MEISSDAMMGMAMAAMQARADAQAGEAQRASWERTFCRPPSACTRDRDSDAGAEVRRWMENWREETDLHHSAALKVQLAWRCFLAKRRVNWFSMIRRSRWRQGLLAEDKREEELEQRIRDLRWRRARSAEERLDDAANVVQRFGRLVAAQRARQRKEGEGVSGYLLKRRQYAATRIQAVHRGNLGRQRVMAIKDPSVVTWQRRLQVSRSAAAIQRIWRGFFCRKRAVRRAAAAVSIQGCFRCSWARGQLSERRQGFRARMRGEREDYAARIVTKAVRYFIRQVVPRRLGAACRLQRAWRSGLARAERKARAEQVVIAKRDAVRHEALSMLQCAFRSAVSRRRRSKAAAEAAAAIQARVEAEEHYGAEAVQESLRASDRVRGSAATSIQCAWKQGQARQLLLRRRDLAVNGLVQVKEDEAALVVQLCMRTHQASLRMKSERSSVRRDRQACIRDEACVRIQCLLRRRQACRSLGDRVVSTRQMWRSDIVEKEAALAIQSWARQRIAVGERNRREDKVALALVLA